MNTERFRGVIPPVPTIVDETGALDKKGMAVLIERVVASGVNGMLLLGSGGEFCHMSTALRKEVAEFTVKQVAGRMPVLLGVGACGTAEVIDLGRHAASIGVDAVLVVNPYYAKLSEEALFRHYQKIAATLEVPVLLYNFPALTGQELTVELVKRLALSCPNIVGIKDTVDSISHTRQLITDVKSARPDFLVFSGFDEYLLDTLILGGDGGVPASSNYAPDICCGIYKAFQNNDLAAITGLEQRLARLMPIYSLDTPYFGLVKEAIRLTGSDISTAVLAPALTPTPETKEKLVDILTKAGVLPKAS